MYKKKDFSFLNKYENMDYRIGSILCTKEWVHINIGIFRESHKIETQCSKDMYFKLESFIEAYKKIHGSRHLFTVSEHGLIIETKKTGEQEIISLEEGTAFTPFFPKGFKDGKLQNPLALSILKSISLELDYVSFLKDTTLVLENDRSYIWKSNGISDIYVHLPFIGKEKGYKVNAINLISQWEGEEPHICIEKRIPGIGCDNLILYDENNIMALSLEKLEEYNTYKLPSSSQKYTLSEKEIDELKKIPIKKLLASIKKEHNLKVGYQVYIEIIDGIWYVNGERFFQVSSEITTRRFEGYKLAEFINNAKTLTLHNEYIQDNQIFFI